MPHNDAGSVAFIQKTESSGSVRCNIRNARCEINCGPGTPWKKHPERISPDSSINRSERNTAGQRKAGNFTRFFNRVLKFVVKLVGSRDLVLKDGSKQNAAKIAYKCLISLETTIEVEKEGQKKRKRLSLGFREVRLLFLGFAQGQVSEAPLYLVVIKGFSEKPMMLLTNLDLPKMGLKRILEIYLTRWKCDESYRFIKQAYNLEDIRLRSYTSLRNVVVLVQAVFYFISVELGKKLKLNILLKKIYEKARGSSRYQSLNSMP